MPISSLTHSLTHHTTMITKAKATHYVKRGSTNLPLSNSSVDKKIKSVLPFFGFINMTISCGAIIYRACIKGDIPMVTFVTFVYFATFVLDYWVVLYHKFPKKLHLKVGIWVLESAIMLGFGFAFSKFMSLGASLFFFGIVIVGNTLLFYAYFVWDGDKNRGVCSSNEEKKRKTRNYCRHRKASLKKYRHIALALENV